MGGIASLGSIPGELSPYYCIKSQFWDPTDRKGSISEGRAHLSAGLFLVIPFSMLATHIDRRLLLVVNAISLLCGEIFMIFMGTFRHSSFSIRLLI